MSALRWARLILVVVVVFEYDYEHDYDYEHEYETRADDAYAPLSPRSGNFRHQCAH